MLIRLQRPAARPARPARPGTASHGAQPLVAAPGGVCWMCQYPPPLSHDNLGRCQGGNNLGTVKVRMLLEKNDTSTWKNDVYIALYIVQFTINSMNTYIVYIYIHYIYILYIYYIYYTIYILYVYIYICSCHTYLY